MPSKSFYLPAPLNASAIEISSVNRPGLHSIKITTTDGAKPSGGSLSSNIRTLSSTGGTNNIDWANSHVKFYDSSPVRLNSTTIVTVALNSIAFDDRYLTQDADGESWSMTSAVNLDFYFAGNNSYMKFLNNGNLSYNKAMSGGTYAFKDWGGNGSSGASVPGGWAELNTLKFRTQSNLDAHLLSTSQKRTVGFTELSATDYDQTLGGQLLFGKYGMGVTLGNGNILVDEFTVSSPVTFNEMSVFCGAPYAQAGSLTFQIHNVSLASFTPTRTAEISVTVPLSSLKFTGDIDVGYALFGKLASSQTLTAGTYCFVVKSSSVISDSALQFATIPGTGNVLKLYNGTSVATYQPSANYKLGFVLSSLAEANTNPTDIILSSTAIAENSPALSVIGSLSVTDAENSPQTYSLVAGAGDTDNELFEISGSDLRLKSGTSLNYEAKSSYSVRIKAIDSADSAYFYEKAFTINVSNVNEAPTNVTLSASSIQEGNAVNAVIGTLSAIDPDTGDTSFTFSITGGADQAKFNISGSSLRASQAFDYEAPADANGDNVYAVEVTATDAGGLTYVKSFNITVSNNTADDPVSVSSTQVVSGTGGKVSVSSASNPTVVEFLLSGSALPVGSIVKWTAGSNQKFLKISGSSTAFKAIPLTPPASWKWSADGSDAWDVLQSF